MSLRKSDPPNYPLLCVGFGQWTRDRVLGPLLNSSLIPLEVTAVTCLLQGATEYESVVKPYFHARSLQPPNYLPDLEDALNVVAGTGSRPVVLISTPNSLHAKHAYASLDQGYDVYVERPLAAQLEDVRQLVFLAEQRGVRLFCGTQRRMEAPYQYIHDAVVNQRDFGSLMTIRCSLSVGERPSGWRLHKELAGGGIVLDSGFHLLDCAAWIAADAGHYFTESSYRMITLLSEDGRVSRAPANQLEHSALGDLTTSHGLRLVFDLTYNAPIGSVYEYFDVRDQDGARITIVRSQSHRSQQPGRVTHQRADGSIVTTRISDEPIRLDDTYLPGRANESGPLRALLEARRHPADASYTHACSAQSALPTWGLIEEIYVDTKWQDERQ
jgi:predicted dehydrogenase